MNKPKIDLKARLGKRTGAQPAGASIPPPVGVSPQPHSSVAPVPQSGGYPGHASGFPQASSYDAMGGGLGVGAVQAPAPVRVAAPISFEGDEEFAAVRRSSRTKVMILAAATALVGGVLGFAVGGLNERNKVAESAVIGAKTLVTEIDAANAAVAKLSDVLTRSNQALKDGKYPEAEVKELGGINIPFDGNNLAGKNIGRFKPQLVTMLINYAEASAKANSQKDKIRSVLSFSKEGVEDLLNQRTNPQVRWGVVVKDGPQGPWGQMTVLPAAFAVAGEKGKTGWPAEFEFADGKQKVTYKRYGGGNAENAVIPVAPATHNAVCPADTMVRLRRELTDMQKVLNGDQTPGQETEGIVQLGEGIKKQLLAIGG